MVKIKPKTDRDDALTGSADRDKSEACGEWAVAAVRSRHFTEFREQAMRNRVAVQIEIRRFWESKGTAISACRRERTTDV